MSSHVLVRLHRPTYHRQLTEASKEVTLIHEHYCPKHKDVYPGYTPKCKEPRELLCGGCLAEEFRK